MSITSAASPEIGRSTHNRLTAAYVAPFLTFVGVMAIEHALGLPPLWAYAVRLIAVFISFAVFSRNHLSFRPSSPLASIVIGGAVFVIWVGPDLLFGYRHSWLFDNALLGSPSSSLPIELRHSALFLILRITGTSVFVPIAEELFWRGWLMRWMIDRDFAKVPLGTYAPSAFWMVAVLFASEHGSYWEVGLLAGIAYNWWLIRTRNLADCILAHAVTNAILAAYVPLAGQWQYWL